MNVTRIIQKGGKVTYRFSRPKVRLIRITPRTRGETRTMHTEETYRARKGA